MLNWWETRIYRRSKNWNIRGLLSRLPWMTWYPFAASTFPPTLAGYWSPVTLPRFWLASADVLGHPTHVQPSFALGIRLVTYLAGLDVAFRSRQSNDNVSHPTILWKSISHWDSRNNQKVLPRNYCQARTYQLRSSGQFHRVKRTSPVEAHQSIDLGRVSTLFVTHERFT